MIVRIPIAWSLSLLVLGCSHRTGGGGDEPDAWPKPPMPDAWQIEVDTSGLDRFLDVTIHPDLEWHVAGSATASKGLASIEIAGAPVMLGEGGRFATDVAVTPGLTRVPIVAKDLAEHAREADRSVIAARFLPEKTHNPAAASLVLTSTIVQAMAGGLASSAGDVDVAAEIRAKQTLSSDAQCTTWPTGATQDKTTVELALDGTQLALHIQVPNLYVSFDGECTGPLGGAIPIAGEMAGSIDIYTTLAPQPGAPCVTAFAHTAPDVQIGGWQFDVWGTGGPLQNWLVELFSQQKGPEAKAQLQTEVAAKADDLLGAKLQNLTLLDKTSTVELLSRPVDMHLCVGAIEKVGTALVARVTASASGAGTRTAPGAPMLDGRIVNPAAKELVLDSDLVAQLLFSAWRDGGLDRARIKQVDLGLIIALARDLEPMFPDGGMADVSIDGELPPVVRATTAATGGMGDLRVEIGDLMLTINAGGVELFRFDVHLTLDLDLIAEDGKLVPMVVASSSEVSLVGEIVDGPDAALELAVQSQLGDAASSLLAGAALSLPSVPGLGAPTGVTPDKNGRFLHVTME